MKSLRMLLAIGLFSTFSWANQSQVIDTWKPPENERLLATNSLVVTADTVYSALTVVDDKQRGQCKIRSFRVADASALTQALQLEGEWRWASTCQVVEGSDGRILIYGFIYRVIEGFKKESRWSVFVNDKGTLKEIGKMKLPVAQQLTSLDRFHSRLKFQYNRPYVLISTAQFPSVSGLYWSPKSDWNWELALNFPNPMRGNDFIQTGPAGIFVSATMAPGLLSNGKDKQPASIFMGHWNSKFFWYYPFQILHGELKTTFSKMTEAHGFGFRTIYVAARFHKPGYSHSDGRSTLTRMDVDGNWNATIQTFLLPKLPFEEAEFRWDRENSDAIALCQNKLYLGTSHLYAFRKYRWYLRSSKDQGQTWEIVDQYDGNPEAKISELGCASDGQTLYASGTIEIEKKNHFRLTRLGG